MWDERIELNVMSGAAIQTSRLGKAHIDLVENDEIRLDYEDDGDELLKPNELEDLINAEVIDGNSVTVWFLEESDKSEAISVPITEWTQITTEQGGAWGPNAFEKSGVLERVQKAVRDSSGKYQSGP